MSCIIRKAVSEDYCCIVEVATNLRREDTHRFYEKNKYVKNGYRFGFDDWEGQSQ